MAIAKKCDVCGVLYEPYNKRKNPDKTNGIMFLNIDDDQDYFMNYTMDCCPECMKSIKEHIEFLKNRKEHNNEEVIR